jgi:hypothetical protein
MPRAMIYRPSKTAMQSGKAGTGQWRLEYETATPREPDPLMGWASAADTLNEVHLRFETLDEAVAFAQKHGIEFDVIKPREPRLRPKSYSDNFRWQRPS